VTAWRVQIAAAVAIVERDLRLFASYRLRPLTLLLGPLTTVTLFYYVSRLVRIEQIGSSEGYFAYVVVGVVGLEVLSSTLGVTPTSLRQELVAGTFERMVVSPFGPVRAVAAMLVFPLAQSLLVAASTVTFAAVAFGLRLSWPDVLLSPFAAVLGGLAFAPFGLLALAALLVFKQTLAIVGIVITGLSIVAGAYFPVQLLPDWVQWISEVQPLTPALDLLRQLVIGTPSDVSPWTDAAKLVGFTVVLLPLSLLAMRAAVAHSRRRGTITEY
jgi:ABC-2 type transport system permease protein